MGTSDGMMALLPYFMPWSVGAYLVEYFMHHDSLIQAFSSFNPVDATVALAQFVTFTGMDLPGFISVVLFMFCGLPWLIIIGGYIYDYVLAAATAAP